MGLLPSASVPDCEYLLRRSTLEAAMAAKARSAPAAAAHHRIASCYLGKLFGDQSASSPIQTSAGAGRSGAVGLGRLRFADLTTVPENDELAQVLRKLP